MQEKYFCINYEWIISFGIVSTFEWLFSFFVACLQQLQAQFLVHNFRIPNLE